jgi:serine/threonine protein kinase
MYNGLVAHKYTVLNPIGGGKFGQVFKGQNLRTGESVAIKLEPSSQEFNLLKHESTILNFLYSKWCRNVPPVYWFGHYGDTHIAMVLPLYDESFVDFVADTELSVTKRADMFLRSAVLILQHIHRHGVVHRDIKPANWMFRISNKECVREMVLIDFGLATFIEPDNDMNANSVKKEHLIGTPKFASWFVHDGQEYTKRDDLLSVLYMALWTYYGDHLWESDREYIHDDTDENIMLPPTHVSSPVNTWLKRVKMRERIVQLCAKTGNEKMVRMAETLYSNHIEYSYCLFS